MVMCIPLICISNRHEFVQTYRPEDVQQITLDAVFSKFLLDHMISQAGELFVLFAYHSMSLVKQLG